MSNAILAHSASWSWRLLSAAGRSAARVAFSMQRSASRRTTRSHRRHAGSHRRCGTPTVCPVDADTRAFHQRGRGLTVFRCVALQCMQMAGSASPSCTAQAMTRMGTRRRLSAGLPCTRCAHRALMRHLPWTIPVFTSKTCGRLWHEESHLVAAASCHSMSPGTTTTHLGPHCGNAGVSRSRPS